MAAIYSINKRQSLDQCKSSWPNPIALLAIEEIRMMKIFKKVELGGKVLDGSSSTIRLQSILLNGYVKSGFTYAIRTLRGSAWLNNIALYWSWTTDPSEILSIEVTTWARTRGSHCEFSHGNFWFVLFQIEYVFKTRGVTNKMAATKIIFKFKYFVVSTVLEQEGSLRTTCLTRILFQARKRLSWTKVVCRWIQNPRPRNSEGRNHEQYSLENRLGLGEELFRVVRFTYYSVMSVVERVGCHYVGILTIGDGKKRGKCVWSDTLCGN